MKLPTYTREITIDAAYDKRDSDPAKNYGIHGAHMWFNLTREDNQGLSFSVATNWYLPHVAEELKNSIYGTSEIYGGAVSYHAHAAKNEYVCLMKNCPITKGNCYSDGSAVLGDEFLATLIAEGTEGLWKRMEAQLEQWLPFQMENQA